MAPKFGFSTEADEVVAAFKDQVKGRTFVITGANAKGLGGKTAVSLARAQPAALILVSRNRASVDPTIDEIRGIDPDIDVRFVRCDLSELDSVRAAAAEINGAVSRIDVLVNNAGVMAIKELTRNSAGVEMTLASNHLGHFLLTNLLAPKLVAAAAAGSGPGPRVVTLSSRGHKFNRFRFEDPNFAAGPKDEYDGWSAYGQSKTANVLFGLELAARLRASGVSSFSLHPGEIFDTGLTTHLEPVDFEGPSRAALKNNGKTFDFDEPKTLAQGASTQLYAALAPGLEERSGAYLEDCGSGDVYDYAVDPENARRLWAWSEEAVGEKFEY